LREIVERSKSHTDMFSTASENLKVLEILKNSVLCKGVERSTTRIGRSNPASVSLKVSEIFKKV
jgi:hypothetical protein